MAEKVVINEVGIRDGLQIQPKFVDTQGKLELCRALIDAGVTWFEAMSFVSPKAVPQMANAAEVYKGLPEQGRINYSALVPIEKGYDRAIEAGAKVVAMALATTDKMNEANIRMPLRTATDVFTKIIGRAKDDGIGTRAYI